MAAMAGPRRALRSGDTRLRSGRRVGVPSPEPGPAGARRGRAGPGMAPGRPGLLDLLPDELVAGLLPFLDRPRDLCALAQACRRLTALAVRPGADRSASSPALPARRNGHALARLFRCGVSAALCHGVRTAGAQDGSPSWLALFAARWGPVTPLHLEASALAGGWKALFRSKAATDAEASPWQKLSPPEVKAAVARIAAQTQPAAIDRFVNKLHGLHVGLPTVSMC